MPNEENSELSPEVPSDLLALHMELEEAGLSAEEFKEVYNDGIGD